MPDNVIPDPPEVEEGHGWMLEAFYDLSTTRFIGAMGGVGVIPYTAILDYIRYWEIDPDSAELFIEVVKSLDSVYTSHLNADSKRRSLANKPKPAVRTPHGGTRRKPRVSSR